MTSGKLVAVKSVRQNAQPQIENLCSKGGLGDFPQQARGAQPQIENLCSKGGLGDFPQQARGAIWIATGIACQSYQKFLITSIIPNWVKHFPTFYI